MNKKLVLLVGGILVVLIGVYLVIAGRSRRPPEEMEHAPGSAPRHAGPASPTTEGARGGGLTAPPPAVSPSAAVPTSASSSDAAPSAEPKVAIPSSSPPSQGLRARLHLDARDRQTAMYRTELSGLRDRVHKLTRQLDQLKRENKLTPQQEQQMQSQIQQLVDAEPRLKRHLEELEGTAGAPKRQRRERRAPTATTPTSR